MLIRIVGFGRDEVLKVVFCLVDDLVFVVDVVVSLAVFEDMEELEVLVGMRLAGVEINHLIKRKSIALFADGILGSGEPIRKELKIRCRGCRRFE